MARINRDEEGISLKTILTVVLVITVIWYLFPRALEVFKQIQYRTKLTNFITAVNKGIQNKVAYNQESFVEMYSYTKTNLGDSPLTPISYIFGKNSCEEKIDTDRFKQAIMPSTCIDGTIISNNNICILRTQPANIINGRPYYMVYLDIDCQGGLFNKEKYIGKNFVDIDNYSINPLYEDIIPLVFSLDSNGNFFLTPFPDKNDVRFKKYFRLYKCNKSLFYDAKCEI